jgi:hypothetical protein
VVAGIESCASCRRGASTFVETGNCASSGASQRDQAKNARFKAIRMNKAGRTRARV